MSDDKCADGQQQTCFKGYSTYTSLGFKEQPVGAVGMGAVYVSCPNPFEGVSAAKEVGELKRRNATLTEQVEACGAKIDHLNSYFPGLEAFRRAYEVLWGGAVRHGRLSFDHPRIAPEDEAAKAVVGIEGLRCKLDAAYSLVGKTEHALEVRTADLGTCIDSEKRLAKILGLREDCRRCEIHEAVDKLLTLPADRVAGRRRDISDMILHEQFTAHVLGLGKPYRRNEIREAIEGMRRQEINLTQKVESRGMRIKELERQVASTKAVLVHDGSYESAAQFVARYNGAMHPGPKAQRPGAALAEVTRIPYSDDRYFVVIPGYRSVHSTQQLNIEYRTTPVLDARIEELGDALEALLEAGIAERSISTPTNRAAYDEAEMRARKALGSAPVTEVGRALGRAHRPGQAAPRCVVSRIYDGSAESAQAISDMVHKHAPGAANTLDAFLAGACAGAGISEGDTIDVHANGSVSWGRKSDA